MVKAVRESTTENKSDMGKCARYAQQYESKRRESIREGECVSQMFEAALNGNVSQLYRCLPFVADINTRGYDQL
jgi:hypothetical protein